MEKKKVCKKINATQTVYEEFLWEMFKVYWSLQKGRASQVVKNRRTIGQF